MNRFWSNAIEASVVSVVYLLIGTLIGFSIRSLFNNVLEDNDPEDDSIAKLAMALILKSLLLGFSVYVVQVYLQDLSILDFNKDPTGHRLVDSVAQNFLAIGAFIFFDAKIEVLYNKLFAEAKNQL